MVPQKTGVSSDFSHTLSHLQRINYSKEFNEDQVPVFQPKWGTATRLAVCYLPSTRHLQQQGLLVEEGDWLSRPVSDSSGPVESRVFAWRHHSSSSAYFLWAAWEERAVSQSPGNCWSTQSTKWISGNCCVISCYQGKFDCSNLSLFKLQGLPLLPEVSNGGLEQSLFILIQHKVFIVWGLYHFKCFLLWNTFLSPVKWKS